RRSATASRTAGSERVSGSGRRGHRVERPSDGPRETDVPAGRAVAGVDRMAARSARRTAGNAADAIGYRRRAVQIAREAAGDAANAVQRAAHVADAIKSSADSSVHRTADSAADPAEQLGRRRYRRDS